VDAALRAMIGIAALLMTIAPAAAQESSKGRITDAQKIYADDSHCLTSPEIRGTNDNSISCFCRDAIADARYVYSTYLLSGKDNNLSGMFLRLQADVRDACGENYNLLAATENKNWKWNGPEVVRTYRSDEVIERIKPEMNNGRPVGRWVPFTVQLVYRDAGASSSIHCC
jgi:hypothetical protein